MLPARFDAEPLFHSGMKYGRQHHPNADKIDDRYQSHHCAHDHQPLFPLGREARYPFLLRRIGVENTYSKRSALDDGANRSLGVVDCEDEFRRTIATFNGAQDATRLQTQTSPLDEDGSDDDGCGEACKLASPRGGKHTLDEIARTSILQSPCEPPMACPSAPLSRHSLRVRLLPYFQPIHWELFYGRTSASVFRAISISSLPPAEGSGWARRWGKRGTIRAPPRLPFRERPATVSQVAL